MYMYFYVFCMGRNFVFLYGAQLCIFCVERNYVFLYGTQLCIFCMEHIYVFFFQILHVISDNVELPSS